MPRRGDHRRAFPVILLTEEPAGPRRIGPRLASGADPAGSVRQIRLDPAQFRCSVLAAELADEWVEYVSDVKMSASGTSLYRLAIRSFCCAVDGQVGDAAAAASLAGAVPNLALVLAHWERTLPASSKPGSTRPAQVASALRALIARRIAHEHRPVDSQLQLLIAGSLGVERGTTRELDEFTRREKRAMVRAGWIGAAALERRLAEGWALAARGQHPADHGWTDVANLLWGLAHQEIAPRDIVGALPAAGAWPAELRGRIGLFDRPDSPLTKITLVRWLVRQLFPGELDMHAFRVLLVAATGGCAPEEITALGEDDIEFVPGGVRLSMTKRRTGRVRHRTFSDNTESPDEPSESNGNRQTQQFLDRPHREVSEIVRRLLAVTKTVRACIDDRDRRLFVTAAVTPAFALRFDRWQPSRVHSGFREWLDSVGVQVEGKPDIRRLRKSGKVEKAIAFGGRIADASDDHHEETFRGHYAQGTTLRVLSGKVITTSQDHWFRRAVEGPTVMAGTGLLEKPDGFESLGLTSEQADGLRQGALDMGVTQCRDPYDSPYSRPGELCTVAPLRCLECRNAWILPSDLPQLLLFADHLERLRRRLSPQHFASLWGQSYTNLQAVLEERTAEEKTVARKRIDASTEGNPTVSLHLPLSAHVEFDA